MAFDLCLGNQGQKTKDLVGGLITARNEVGARLCFTRVCDSVHGGGVLSQHALQVVSQHALQQVSRGRGGIPACLPGFQAHP